MFSPHFLQMEQKSLNNLPKVRQGQDKSLSKGTFHASPRLTDSKQKLTPCIPCENSRACGIFLESRTPPQCEPFGVPRTLLAETPFPVPKHSPRASLSPRIWFPPRQPRKHSRTPKFPRVPAPARPPRPTRPPASRTVGGEGSHPGSRAAQAGQRIGESGRLSAAPLDGEPPARRVHALGSHGAGPGSGACPVSPPRSGEVQEPRLGVQRRGRGERARSGGPPAGTQARRSREEGGGPWDPAGCEPNAASLT